MLSRILCIAGKHIAGALFLQLLLFPYGLNSQTAGMRFKHLSLENGLSQTSVTSILQDSQGFLWFGTRDGLNRFDGYRFKHYKNDPDRADSISDNMITTIYEDRSGILWVGTFGSGLNRYNRQTGGFTRFKQNAAKPGVRGDAPGTINHNDVTCIIQDSDGGLWVGTAGGGLNCFDYKNQKFSYYTHQPGNPNSLSNNRVFSICEDREGFLWIGTFGGGLNRFDRKTGEFTHYRHQENNANSLGYNSVRSIYEDHSGNLWVGTFGGGLDRFDRKKGIFRHFTHDNKQIGCLPNNTVNTIIEDRFGIMWVGTNGGLSRFNRKKGTFKSFLHRNSNPTSLSYNLVGAIYEDRSGVLWIGTDGGGINRISAFNRNFEHHAHIAGIQDSLSHNDTFAIYEDKDEVLWVGTMGGGLNRLEPGGSGFTIYTHDPYNSNSLSSNQILSICQDRQGNLWVGTYGGGLNQFTCQPGQRLDMENCRVIRYKNQPGNVHSLIHDYVSSIFEDSSGILWIGTYRGLNRFDPDTGNFYRYIHVAGDVNSISHNAVRCIFEDGAGILWIGTHGGGLNRLDRKSGRFTNFAHEPGVPLSLSDKRVSCIFEDRSGTLWIGTGGGLNKFDRESLSFKHYREKNGMPNDKIQAILEDESGHLWISTNMGLTQFNPATEQFKNFDLDDGLQSNEFNSGTSYKNSKGKMFFGGKNGLTAFYPELIIKDNAIPKLVITNFLLFNRPAERWQQRLQQQGFLSLSYKESLITIEFSALHFANPKRNRYSYKLEGLDSGWIETDSANRRATYTKLPGGTYRFRVRGSNRDGVWNMEGASIVLKISPPPWQTWWAYCLYVLVVAGLVLWFVVSQRRKVAYERSVIHRLKQVDRLKDEFLSNTSHELRTPLNGIIGLAESLRDGVTGPLNEKTNSHLSLIINSGKRLSNLVNDILDFSRLKNRSMELHRRPIDLKALTEVVITLSTPLIGDKDLRLLNEIPEGLPTVEADEDRLQQIMYNLVDNAIKFTDSGFVHITAAVDISMLRVDVKDSGIGIPPDKHGIIFKSFEKAGEHVNSSYAGTGLGLAVTKQLVELHGGKIGVTSAENNGTTIWFTLPVTSKTSNVVPKEQISHSARNYGISIAAEAIIQEGIVPLAENQIPGDFHILVVDDDPVNRQVILNYLAMKKYTVTLASSGREALHVMSSAHHFDLIILDIMMPRMSGYEVCRKIRENHPSHELPIIFLTAKNQVADLVAGFSAGANDFITKPVSKNELLSRIHTHLQLLEINRNLEEKVEERTRELQTKNLQITSSIQYARTIQAAILPVKEEMNRILPEHFVLFKPKDIVSGDFYWLKTVGDMIFLAVVDCTGHGVPAAFMSMVGCTLLDKIIVEQKVTDPAVILQQLHVEVRGILKQEQSMGTVDGMEVSLCCILRTHPRIRFAGAKSPLYWVKMNGEHPKLTVIKGDSKPIGGKQTELERIFTNHNVNVKEGDIIYLTSDGFPDQGDSKEKKYGSRRFRLFLETIANQNIRIQKELLTAELANFQEDEEQRDDITILGVKM